MTNNTWFMVKYLTIIIVFLVLLFFGSRYLVKVRAVAKKGSIKVVDVLKLGSDSFVYIVETMNRRYLVAQNKSSIILLDKETDKDANSDEADSCEKDFDKFLEKTLWADSPQQCSNDSDEQN